MDRCDIGVLWGDSDRCQLVNFCNIFRRLSIRASSTKELKIIKYLGKVGDFLRTWTELGGRDEDQEIIKIYCSPRRIREELKISPQSFYYTQRKLESAVILEREYHKYYPGRTFLRLTRKGRGIYEVFAPESQ